MVVRVTMDIFHHRYYRLNKINMILIGQWPYNSFRARCFFRAIVIYFNSSEIISLILDILKHRNDIGILLDCAIPLLTLLVCLTVVIAFMANSQKTVGLLTRIHTDWQVWAHHQEINILHEYAEQGRKINTIFIAMIYSSISINVSHLVTYKIIDVLLKNGTEPGKFPTHVNYYRIDTQRYYFYVMIYYCLMALVISMVIVTNHVMLVSYVLHASGVLAALGHKLERIRSNDTTMATEGIAFTADKRVVAHLAWCMDRHNDAIEYAHLIEALYTWNIFFIMVIGMILINILGLQVLLNTNDTETMIQMGVFALAVVFLFFMDCYFSQILIDHSVNIHFNIYNSQWYSLSVKAQKFLQLMMIRCTVSCQLTAGRMLILSLRTFGLTFRTTASYFAMVRSTQGL